jgi:hypothetical protein
VHHVPVWHVKIDFQKINVFADESFSIPVNFCNLLIIAIEKMLFRHLRGLNVLALLPDAGTGTRNAGNAAA